MIEMLNRIAERTGYEINPNGDFRSEVNNIIDSLFDYIDRKDT